MSDPQPQDPLLIPIGGNNMTTDQMTAQIASESLQGHSFIMLESKGNMQNVNNLARMTGVKKFDEVQAIESAAVEKILQAKGT